MQTLSNELRATIVRHLEIATRADLLAITSALCANEAAFDAERAVTPAPILETRFTAVAGVVRDHTTKLEWTRGNVSDKRLTWAEADEACKKLELNGGGWRLPTIQELLSLVDYERHDPAINPVFECQPNWYWASTPYAPSPADSAWVVSFGSGGASYGVRSYDGFVRAVRGGQF